MALTWHRVTDKATGVTTHTLMHGTSPVGHAVRTGWPGVDNYPWDWHLTAVGTTMARMNTRKGEKPRRVSGVCDTLRAAKASVQEAVR